MNLLSPTDVIVGEEYLVPSGIIYLSSKKSKLYKIIPILFPSHKDGQEICVPDDVRHYHIDSRFTNEYVACSEELLRNIKYRKLKCIKTLSNSKSTWIFMIERLHKLYENHTITSNRCPHQGLPLINKCGTCPGHNLIWNLETGKLKYKLPFFARLVSRDGLHSTDKAEIVGSRFDIKFTKNPDILTVNGERLIEVELVDSNNQVYPDVKLRLEFQNDFVVGNYCSLVSNACHVLGVNYEN